MRVLHIVQRYWPVRGGAENHLHALSSRLVADGHDVTVLTSDAEDFELFWHPGAGRFPDRQIRHDGVRILRFPVRHLPISQIAYPAIRRFLWLMSNLRPVPVSALHLLARFTPWMPDLWRWLQETQEQFDLVAGMTITFESLLEAGLRFARARGLPYVVYPLTHLGAGARPGADALSRFYTMRHQVDLVLRSDAVVAQTAAERDFYVDRGLAPSAIQVTGPGFDPVEVAGGDADGFLRRHGLGHPIVYMLTKMSYDKGVTHTIEAMRVLWGRGSKAHLVLAGDLLDTFGGYYGNLPQSVRDRILLLGTVSDQERRDLLAAGDILSMPSRTDSFGIVYLEAWAYTKPVVGAKTWGVTDVISDGEDGLLVPFGDVNALAEALDYLLVHRSDAQAMGERGRRKAIRRHTWDRKYGQVRDLYEELVRPA